MQRHGVGQAADVTGDDGDRAELAHRARVAQQDAVEQAPFDVGQRHAPERREAGRTERSRGLFLVAALIGHQRDQFARDEREGDEDRGKDYAGQGEDDLDVMLGQPWSQPALEAEHQHIDQARDDWRNREGQVYQRDQQTLAREIELRHRPRGRDTEQRVEWHGDRGGDEGEAHGGECIRLFDRIPGSAEAIGHRLREDRCERQKQEQSDESERQYRKAPAHQKRVLGWRTETLGHRLALHACSRLSIRSITNEIASMMTPIADAAA